MGEGAAAALEPWVKEWALDEVFAGVSGQGAEDAAYAAAVLMEKSKLKGEHVTGGAADIYKCFDQVMRPLIYLLLEEAGMPKSLIEAYKNFQENLLCHNTLAGSIGKAYKKVASIPQGDPFSMMVVSLLLRPWILQMRMCAVYPRVLADDLQLISTGNKHLEHFEFAFNKTHEHLFDMGARLAPNKSVIFSIEKSASNYLRMHKWRRLGRTLKVITDCRDLGAHLTVSTCRKLGTTLTG